MNGCLVNVPKRPSRPAWLLGGLSNQKKSILNYLLIFFKYLAIVFHKIFRVNFFQSPIYCIYIFHMQIRLLNADKYLVIFYKILNALNWSRFSGSHVVAAHLDLCKFMLMSLRNFRNAKIVE